MGNTLNANLVKLSQHIYKEWRLKTVLVQSCDNAFEGEFDLETNEIDIPIYHDLSIHKTTLKERELKPAPIEFMKGSVKRVTIDKGRYTHWGKTKLNTLVDRLTQEESQTRDNLTNKWAQDAEEELAVWCAKLPTKQTIDLKTMLTVSDTNAGGNLTSTNILKALDILKAFAIDKKMSPKDFTLFASEKFETVLRDSKILLGSNLDANSAFKSGYVGEANGVTVRQIEVPTITKRDDNTKLVKAEWAIWKTTDGIQYVVPFKDTVTYEIPKTEILLGGTGYQTVEYYDFFNIYPSRLYKVKISYDSENPPTSF